MRGSVAPAQALHLPCISPPSPLHLPSISAVSPLHLRCISQVRGSVAPAQGRADHRPKAEAVAEGEAAEWRQVRSADASLGYSTAVHADLAAGVTGQSVGTTCS